MRDVYATIAAALSVIMLAAEAIVVYDRGHPLAKHNTKRKAQAKRKRTTMALKLRQLWGQLDLKGLYQLPNLQNFDTFIDFPKSGARGGLPEHLFIKLKAAYLATEKGSLKVNTLTASRGTHLPPMYQQRTGRYNGHRVSSNQPAFR
jgi:hypothetical protein